MRSPASAIGWEIWRQNRANAWILVTMLGLGIVAARGIRGDPRWTALAEAASYALVVLALLLTFGSLHYTEGQPKGGFGSFPMRLFNLPATTFQLVAYPMVYGVLSVITVYLAAAWLILAPLDRTPPILWPCLYLVCGITQFQTILWSFPESRYLKLLLLSVAASVLTFGWMFFLPHMIEGTLRDWGYQGSVEAFKSGLLVALAAVGPGSFMLSLCRVRQQRHGAPALRRTRFPTLSGWLADVAGIRSPRLPSPTAALFWREARQTGFILPVSVAALLGMTCLPSYLSAPLSGSVTLGLLIWIFLTPLLLAAILGIGISKFDFWTQELAIPPFDAVRPVTSGDWVFAKLKVASISVLATWAMVLYVSFLWTAFAGDLGELDRLFRELTFRYPASRHWPLVGLLLVAMVILTWRLMILPLAVGLSGGRRWYWTYGALTALGLAACLTLTLWQSDQPDPPLQLYRFWGLIVWLPWILGVAVVLKAVLSAWSWTQALRRRHVSVGSAGKYFVAWLIATGLISVVLVLAFPATDWLRHLASLLALLSVPLAGPGLAILTLARNRRGS